MRSKAGCAGETDAGKFTSLQAARLTKMGIPMKPNALMKFSPMSESAAQGTRRQLSTSMAAQMVPKACCIISQSKRMACYHSSHCAESTAETEAA